MAGAAGAEQRQALLGGAQEEELWSHAVQVEPGRPAGGPSVAELVKASPGTVIATLQATGIQRVAHFCLPDKLVLERIGDEKIATMGASRASLEYEEAWRQELGPCCQQSAERSRRGEGSNNGSSGGGGNGSPAKADSSEGGDWCSDVPVLAYVVSVRDAAAPARRGLLRPLIRRWQAGGCGAATFMLPVVQAVVDWKWRFCRRLLVAEMLLFMAWLASVFGFALAHKAEDDSLSLGQLLAIPRGQLAVAAELCGLAAMLPFLYGEACTALAYRAGFWDLWKLVDVATYALQVTIVIVHLGRVSAGARILPVAVAAQCVLLLFRLQFFSRAFPATRFAFIDDIREVLRDMKWFLLFMVLVMAGFATAFVVLFAPDAAAGRGKKEFAGLGCAWITMLSWVSGDPNLTLLYDNVTHPLAACVLGTCYIFVFTLVLTTLLISLMTNTLQRVTQDEAAHMMLSKALIIDELESTIPGVLQRLWPQMHPAYLHVLRIDPDRLDAVRLDRLWKSLSDEEAAHAAQGSGAAAAKPAVEGQEAPASSAELAALREDVRELRRLLQASLAQLPAWGTSKSCS